jgi:hypothetical protein
MYSYDPANKILKISRVQLPDVKTEDVMDIVIDSYDKYLNTVVYEDIQYLLDTLSEEFKVKIETLNIQIKLNTHGANANSIPDSRKFYVVYADLLVNDKVVMNGVALFRFPYMSKYGTMANKVMVNELIRLEEISYDKKKKDLLIVMPNRTMTFNESATGNIQWKGYGTSKLHVYQMLVAYLIESGALSESDIPGGIANMFYSSAIRRYANMFYDKLPLTYRDSVSKFIRTGDSLKGLFSSSLYKLGKCRHSLNRHLSFDKAVGLRLAEPVPLKNVGITLPAGLAIDMSVLGMLNSNFVTRIVVEATPNIVGHKLGKDIAIAKLPRGTKCTSLIKRQIPVWKDYDYLPEEIECRLFFKSGTVIDDSLLSVMYHAGIEEVFTESDKIPYTFKHEIITNNMVKIMDLFNGKPYPPDMIFKPTDYIYIPAIQYRLDDLSTILCDENRRSTLQPETLTYDDVLAIVAFAVGVKDMPDVFVTYDRDEDFVKKLSLIDSTYSRMFRRCVPAFCRANQVQIGNFFSQRSADAENVFYKLSAAVSKRLMESTISRPADFINPIAVIAGARQISTLTENASANQRSIVMGHFGRLDPYETPAGKKIGLTTTLPYCCRVVDENIEVPYYPIVKTGGKAYVSNNVKWLTQLDELSYRIGDILSIQTAGSDIFGSPIIPTNVIARVPAMSNADEKMTADMVLSTDLDYVTVSPEQTLGVTAQLIPFLGADDGVRASYAISMIKQALYLVNSEVPRVMTSMYSKVFAKNDNYVIRAPYNGTVTGIVAKSIYTDSGAPIPVREDFLTNDSLTMMNLKVKDGDSITKGEVLADTLISKNGFFSPGVNLFVAYVPFYGENNEDAFPISQQAAAKFTSVDVNMVSKEYPSRESDISMFTPSGKKYVAEGDVAFTVKKSVTGGHQPTQSSVTSPRGKSGIVYRNDKQEENMSVKYSTALVDFSELQEGDKIAGRHGNKSTVSHCRPGSTMPMFKNGIVVEGLQNPCGIPSRMNIGQQFEAHLGFCCYMLDIYTESDSFNGATASDIDELWQFVYDCAHAESFLDVFKSWKHLPSGLLNQAKERMSFMQEWKGAFLPHGLAILINQITGKPFEYPVAFGVGYYMKLKQEVAHKVHARTGVVGVEYTQLEKQPPRGSARGGGQRFGEMEFDALHAYGAYHLSREMLNEKSDNVAMRERLAPVLTDDKARVSDIDYDMTGTSTRCSEVFGYYLEVAGLETEYSGGYDLSLESVRKRTRLRTRKMPSKTIKAPELSADVLAELANFGLADPPEQPSESEAPFEPNLRISSDASVLDS